MYQIYIEYLKSENRIEQMFVTNSIKMEFEKENILEITILGLDNKFRWIRKGKGTGIYYLKESGNDYEYKIRELKIQDSFGKEISKRFNPRS